MIIRIVTDSTCDLPEEIVRQQEITVIPLHINVGEKSYLDGVDLTREEFYAQLPNFSPYPKTAAPGTEVFLQAFERLANEGARAILSIHFRDFKRHGQLGTHRRRTIYPHPCHSSGFKSAQPRFGIPC